MCKFYCDILNRSGVDHECDGQTDRQTDGRTDFAISEVVKTDPSVIIAFVM